MSTHLVRAIFLGHHLALVVGKTTVAKPAAATPSFRAGETRHGASAIPKPAAARQASGPAETEKAIANPSSESSFLVGNVWSQIRGAVQRVLGGPEQKRLQPQARQQQGTSAQHPRAKRIQEEEVAPQAVNSRAITGFRESSLKEVGEKEQMISFVAKGENRNRAALMVKAMEKARQLASEKREAAAKAAAEAKAAVRARLAAVYRNKVKGIASETKDKREPAEAAKDDAQRASRDTADAEKAADDRVLAEKAASENVAVEKVFAQKVATDAVAPKEAELEKSSMGKPSELKVAAEKAAAESGVMQKATTTEVAIEEAAEEKAAMAKAVIGNAAMERAAADETSAKTGASDNTAEKAAQKMVAKERVAAETPADANKRETTMEEAAAKKNAAEKSTAEEAVAGKPSEKQVPVGKAITYKNAAEKAASEETATKHAAVETVAEAAAHSKTTEDVVSADKVAAENSAASMVVAAKTSVKTRVEQKSVAGTGMATAGRVAADKVDAKKVMSEKVSQRREAAGAERASRLAKVKAERAAKLAKIKADRKAQSLENRRVKNHSLALRSQMQDAVEHSLSQSRATRSPGKSFHNLIDGAPETQAAVVAAEDALRTLGAAAPAIRLQLHSEVSTKLPDVDSLLAPAAGRFQAWQAQAKAIQEKVDAQLDASRAAIAQKMKSYQQQLAERALESKSIANSNQELRNSIAAQSKSSAELNQEARRLLKARAVLHQALDGLVPKLALAKNFLADSLDITNDADSQALKVLRPTTPAPTLDHYLGLARQNLGVTHSDHHVALLETNSQTKARRNPLEDEERKPNTASDVLAGRLIELKGQQESGAAELSSHYSHLLEGADAYHASLLAEQGSLNTTLASLRQSTEGLKAARTYLQAQVLDLEARLDSFRSFVGHLGSSLNELTMRANTELEGVTLSLAPKATSREPLHKRRRVAAGTQRQRKVAH